MTARELRIGNYIDRNGLMEVRVISQSGVKIYDHVNNIFPPTFFDFDENIKPIPLTEEWLLKFGFKKDGTNYQKGWFYLHGNNRTGTIDFLLNEPYSNKYNATVLQFVHQLQNLYFALTGNELTIKTNKP